MDNPPHSYFSQQPTWGGPTSTLIHLHSATVDQLILSLPHPQKREEVLHLLNKKRETTKDLGPLLWNSLNTVSVLLQEVTSVYSSLLPGQLTTRASNRVCNALSLLQCLASHPNTHMSFIKAKIPNCLFPFINTIETETPFENLRLASLAVFGALLKVDDSTGSEVMSYLLERGLFPLCLRCLLVGNELTKTVATFIVSKILMQDQGKCHCYTSKRLYAVMYSLASILENLSDKPSLQLLKNIIQCYISLSEMPRHCDVLQYYLPAKLRDATFTNLLNEDPSIVTLLQVLLHNVTTGHWAIPKPVEEVFAGSSGDGVFLTSTDE